MCSTLFKYIIHIKDNGTYEKVTWPGAFNLPEGDVQAKCQTRANIPHKIIINVVINVIIVIHMTHGQCYIVLSSQLNCTLP